MPAIVAANVTYTIDKREKLVRSKQNQVQIVFGDGALTYPSGGIPLTVNGLGLSKAVDSLKILEGNANGYRYEWDKSANTIRIMRQNLRTGSTAVAAAESGALIEDSQAIENANLRIPKTAIDVDYDIGPGGEVATAHAPAATTLIAEVTGW